MESNLFVQSLRYIFRDVAGDILLYPVWWYTTGLKLAVNRFLESTTSRSRALALGIQFANLFRPMYADYSIQGRLISFVMRILVLVFRLVEMSVFAVGYLLVLFLWVLAPIVVVAGLLHQLFLIDLRVLLPFLQ